jgi:ABC-2 type transport system ATP-binding protein
MTAMIEVEHLVKTFRVRIRKPGMLGTMKNIFLPESRPVHAVEDVSFQLQKGELVGYLGPNGAGKSTTLKVLTGLLVPSAGRVMVNGYVPWKERTRYVAGIGAVFGQRTTLWWDLPVIDSLELIQPMYRAPEARFKSNLREFTAMLGLEEFLTTPVRSISLGQRMRAELCAALLHEPELVFLDEPTIGLDVVAKERIRQFIQHIHTERGTTIILTTHDLSDVERLCERVLILDHGHLLYDGDLQRLVERFEGLRLLVVTMMDDQTNFSLPELDLPVRQGRQLTFRFDPHRISAADLVAKIQTREQIADLEIRRPGLEDTIRRIYEQKLLVQSSTLPE